MLELSPATAIEAPRAFRPAGRGVLAGVGETPLVAFDRFLDNRPVELWAKLEGCNPGGSAKARSAAAIITDAIAARRVGPETTVVESTSGNMGVGLAQACGYYGLGLICVTDYRTNPSTIAAMRALGGEVRVLERDELGGADPLEVRLRMVEELAEELPDAFWPNQYANPSNPAAHALGTMREIDEALAGRLDYLFVATGTAGTLAGCLDYLERHDRPTRVIAVDALGSALFGGRTRPRLLPGMGAGQESEISRGVRPDRVVRVSELECVLGCRRLARREAILAGASSGGVLAAVEQLAPELEPDARCAVILADRGEAYLDTVYDDGWVASALGCAPTRLADLVGEAQ